MTNKDCAVRGQCKSTKKRLDTLGVAIGAGEKVDDDFGLDIRVGGFALAVEVGHAAPVGHALRLEHQADLLHRLLRIAFTIGLHQSRRGRRL